MTASAAAPRPAGDGGYAPAAYSQVAVYILVRLLLGLGLLIMASLAIRSRPEAVAEMGGQFRLAAGLFLVMGVSAAMLPRFGDREWFTWSQLVLDTVFATALVSFTGGPMSPFFPLYFLNIVAAAWLLQPRGPLVVAVLDTVAFVVVLGVRGLPALQKLYEGSVELMYAQITLQIFAFGLVGLLSGILSGNVRKARAALAVQVRQTRELQERHDLVLDGIETGVLLVDGEGRVQSSNGSAARLLGDTAGRPLDGVLSPSNRRWEQLLIRGDDVLSLECSRMPMAEGGELVLLEDVTRLREMEAAVAREERLSAVGRLAASLAHEIRNPLASLSGSVQLLRESEPSPLHDIVLREVKRLNELVEDFLDTSRPVRLDLQRHDVGQLVGDVVAAFRNDARYKGRRVLRTHAAPGLPDARVDGARIRQVLWNLLLNAAEATPDYGTIEVRVAIDTGWLVLTITDDGVGISPAALRSIFDPFYTTRSGGTGLGLANVERVARAHGGTVDVGSEPGQGTRFVVRLPIDGPELAPEPPTSEVEAPPSPPQESVRVR